MNTKEDFTAFAMVGDGEQEIEVTSFNNNMCIITPEMPIMISKQQAARFFGLIEPDCERRNLAGKAMQGIISNTTCKTEHPNWKEAIAADALAVADALLQELSK